MHETQLNKSTSGEDYKRGLHEHCYSTSSVQYIPRNNSCFGSILNFE